MRKSFIAFCITLIACYALLSATLLHPAAASAGPSAPGASPMRQVAAATPIQHVVVIYQENHTFDDVLGAVCQTRSNPCNGYAGPVTFADGTTASNIVQPDVVPTVDHAPDAQASGLSNQWDKIGGCLTAPHRCVSHSDPANIPNLAALANTFAVSDATFAAGKSASFGAHVTLAAGTFDGFAGYNPRKSTTGAKVGPGWGCPSNRDALWGPPGHQDFEPSCIPDEHGKGPYRDSPVPYVPTVMERMESARLSWHIYQGAPSKKPEDSVFSLCTYFDWCYHNRFRTQYDSSSDDFISAAQGGRLPNLSLIMPVSQISQHNSTSMRRGDNYIGDLVSSVENSPEWDSTAIFITYDDCGCFYDHVVPPAGLGLRNPMVIVSPWAKPAYTDSTTAVQPYSMLAFIQHNFGLASLTSDVDNAYDYRNSFDFGQQPLVGPAMTRTGISAGERARLAKLAPTIEDDPT